MPEENHLKAIILKAKHVCTHKHTLVLNGASGSIPDELSQAKTELDGLFSLFDDPALFLVSQNIDNAALSLHIVGIDLLNPQKQSEYLIKIKAFTVFLRDKVWKILQEAADNNLPSDWNVLTLEALKILRRKVTGRKRFFKNQGEDPNGNPDFASAEKRYKELRKKYQEKLESNEILADASDHSVLDTFKLSLQNLEVFITFIEIIKQINTFIEGELQIPNDNNPT